MKKIFTLTLMATLFNLNVVAHEFDQEDKIKPEGLPSGMVVRENLETGAVEVFSYDAQTQILDEADAILANDALQNETPLFSTKKSELKKDEPVKSHEFDHAGETATQAWVNFWYNPYGYSSYYNRYNRYRCNYALTYYTRNYYNPYYNTYYMPRYYGYSYNYYWWY